MTESKDRAIARSLVPAPGELPVWGTLFVPTAAATVLLLGGCCWGRDE